MNKMTNESASTLHYFYEELAVPGHALLWLCLVKERVWRGWGKEMGKGPEGMGKGMRKGKGPEGIGMGRGGNRKWTGREEEGSRGDGKGRERERERGMEGVGEGKGEGSGRVRGRLGVGRGGGWGRVRRG